MLKNDLIGRIEKLLKNHNITKYKVCKDCKISESQFSQVINKYPKRNFTVEQYIKLSDYFNVSLDWLILGHYKKHDSQKIALLNQELLKYKNEVNTYKKYREIIIQISEILSSDIPE